MRTIEERVGQRWEETEYAKLFLSAEWCFARDVLEAYQERRVYIKHLVKVNARLNEFSESTFGVKVAFIEPFIENIKAPPPYVYPIPKKTEEAGRLWDKWEDRGYFPCPVTNPVERILADNKLSHRALAQRLSRHLTISSNKIARLARGEAVMRPKVAEALGREFGEEPETVLLEYDTWRAGFSWQFTPVPLGVLPYSSQSGSPKLEHYGAPEFSIFQYRLCSAIGKLWMTAPRIQRCALSECQRLFLPAKRAHAQKYCSARCRKRAHYLIRHSKYYLRV